MNDDRNSFGNKRGYPEDPEVMSCAALLVLAAVIFTLAVVWYRSGGYAW